MSGIFDDPVVTIRFLSQRTPGLGCKVGTGSRLIERYAFFREAIDVRRANEGVAQQASRLVRSSEGIKGHSSLGRRSRSKSEDPRVSERKRARVAMFGYAADRLDPVIG